MAWEPSNIFTTIAVYASYILRYGWNESKQLKEAEAQMTVFKERLGANFSVSWKIRLKTGLLQRGEMVNTLASVI
jgi:hypothetical protein